MEKLLTLLFKVFVLILIFIVCGCSNTLYTKDVEKYANSVYVSPIPEVNGMVMYTELQKTFKNTNINNVKYILKISINTTSSYQLTDKYGFATQDKITFYVKWSILNKKTNKIVFNSYDYYNGYYTIEHSSYATNNNKNNTLKLVSKSLAKNISLKTLALLKQNHGNLDNLKATTLDSITPEDYENLVEYKNNNL